MAELTVDDVQAFTKGRLDPEDPETERILKAALRAARQFCGWRVNAVAGEQLAVDSPGGRLLSLPTLALTELTSVVEDGVELDVSDLRVSTRLGNVTKKSGASWVSGYGAVVVTMTHGLDDPDDADFNQAVLQAVNALSQSASRADSSLKRKKVDDVEYEWFESAGSVIDKGLLAPYRILLSP